jgi:hypothetical protein
VTFAVESHLLFSCFTLHCLEMFVMGLPARNLALSSILFLFPLSSFASIFAPEPAAPVTQASASVRGVVADGTGADALPVLNKSRMSEILRELSQPALRTMR